MMDGKNTFIYIGRGRTMIPEHDNYIETPPTRENSAPEGLSSWRLHLADDGQRIDELEAIAQSVYAILRTERYAFPVYSHSHGLYTADLVGQSKRYIFPILKSRITEALLMDDRILAVEDFYIDPYQSVGRTLAIGYKIRTIAGDLEGSEELSV